MEISILNKKSFDELRAYIEGLWVEQETTLFLVPIIEDDAVSVDFANNLKLYLEPQSLRDNGAVVLIFDIKHMDATTVANWLHITRLPSIVVYDFQQVLPHHHFSDNNLVKATEFILAVLKQIEKEQIKVQPKREFSFFDWANHLKEVFLLIQPWSM